MNPTLESKLADVVVEGMRFETLWLEPRDRSAKTLVVLHEGLDSIALWQDFPHQLAARTGCLVLVYSRYGHGNSDRLAGKRPVDFMHHEGEVVLPELVDKLDVERPILLGHSHGGSIVLICAGKYPNRARALILEAPRVFVEELRIDTDNMHKISSSKS